MRKFVSAASVAAALFLTSAAFGAVGFTVSGSRLLDANGNNFIPIGVNNPHAWFDTDSYNALPSLAARRVNCIRIVWSRTLPASRLDQIMTRCEELKMVPMVEIHTGTGSTNPAELNANAQYFATNAAIFKKHERTVLINIGNEWGDRSSVGTPWRDAYKTAITTIRNSGIVTTLVCDGPNWGQDASSALTYGQELINHDPQHNIMFSVHMYGSWNDAARINTTMQSFKDKNLVLVIGEFGWNFNNGNNNLNCQVNHKALMDYAKNHGYGILAWSTKGNNSENAWLDLTTDWRTPTTPWGNDCFNYANGITARGVTASIFNSGGGGGGTTPGNGTFRIISRISGKALDAPGTADGTQLVQWTYGGGNNQRWTLQDRGSSQFSIIGVASGKALDVNTSSSVNGTKVQLWTYSGGNNQKWRFTATTNGFYRVTPVHATGVALDVKGQSLADGALIQIWAYSGGNNQQWSFSAP